MSEMTALQEWLKSMKETFLNLPRSASYLNNSMHIVLHFIVQSFGAWYLTNLLNYCYLNFTSV